MSAYSVRCTAVSPDTLCAVSLEEYMNRLGVRTAIFAGEGNCVKQSFSITFHITPPPQEDQEDQEDLENATVRIDRIHGATIEGTGLVNPISVPERYVSRMLVANSAYTGAYIEDNLWCGKSNVPSILSVDSWDTRS